VRGNARRAPWAREPRRPPGHASHTWGEGTATGAQAARDVGPGEGAGARGRRGARARGRASGAASARTSRRGSEARWGTQGVRDGARRGRVTGQQGHATGLQGARREEERGGEGREREEGRGELTSGSKSGDHHLQNLGHNGEEREGIVRGRIE
jgi:hypothetical protein